MFYCYISYNLFVFIISISETLTVSQLVSPEVGTRFIIKISLAMAAQTPLRLVTQLYSWVEVRTTSFRACRIMVYFIT